MNNKMHGEEFSSGKMDENIKDPTRTIRKKVKEPSHGLTEENTLETGI